MQGIEAMALLLLEGQPSYKATILENKLCVTVFNIPLTKGHPSNKARFSIPLAWPLRGRLLYIIIIYTRVWHCKRFNTKGPATLRDSTQLLLFVGQATSHKKCSFPRIPFLSPVIILD